MRGTRPCFLSGRGCVLNARQVLEVRAVRNVMKHRSRSAVCLLVVLGLVPGWRLVTSGFACITLWTSYTCIASTVRCRSRQRPQSKCTALSLNSSWHLFLNVQFCSFLSAHGKHALKPWLGHSRRGWSLACRCRPSTALLVSCLPWLPDRLAPASMRPSNALRDVSHDLRHHHHASSAPVSVLLDAMAPRDGRQETDGSASLLSD
jgi:hypothetical protein